MNAIVVVHWNRSPCVVFTHINTRAEYIKHSVYFFFLPLYTLPIATLSVSMCVNRQASGWRLLCVLIRFLYVVFCVSVCVLMRARRLFTALSLWSKQTLIHTHLQAVTQSHTMLWQCISCVDKAEVSMAFFRSYNREWRIRYVFFHCFNVFVSFQALLWLKYCNKLKATHRESGKYICIEMVKQKKRSEHNTCELSVVLIAIDI